MWQCIRLAGAGQGRFSPPNERLILAGYGQKIGGCSDLSERLAYSTSIQGVVWHTGATTNVDVAGQNRPLPGVMEECGKSGQETPNPLQDKGFGNDCHSPSERRARDSNPQPVARHLISSQTANHSLTLRKCLCTTILRYTWPSVKGVYVQKIGQRKVTLQKRVTMRRRTCKNRLQSREAVPPEQPSSIPDRRFSPAAHRQTNKSSLSARCPRDVPPRSSPAIPNPR
jgi:hypothetical protein